MRLATVAILLTTAGPAFCQTAVNRASYIKYIEPLLTAKDFGTSYVDDGAGDETVLFPSNQKPADAVLALVRFRSKSLPLLIDCLDNGRLTHAEFGLDKPIPVPLGFVCLDILIGIANGPGISIPDCADDGMGACIQPEFYFRPTDWTNCNSRSCRPAREVTNVQRNWRRLLQRKRLTFKNPYNGNPQYANYADKRK